MICQTITVDGATEGKEIVFEFSGPIASHLDTVVLAINKIMSLLGGKDVYIEDGTKLVVVI